MDSKPGPSAMALYWTAFIGLFFDYYDLYLFIYLEKPLTAAFSLTTRQSNGLQFTAIAGVGTGALVFGYLADRFGRGRLLRWVFGVYVLGIAGLAAATTPGALWMARLVASAALGAEWGISHALLAEHVGGRRRYRFSALLQFAILGGLLAALLTRFALPVAGWRWLFGASVLPVAVLAWWRWRWLSALESAGRGEATAAPIGVASVRAPATAGATFGVFARCFALASLTIASGTVNVFFAKELPQSPWYTVLFWANVAPGMLLGAWVVRRLGVRAALLVYAAAVVGLSLFAWVSDWPGRKLAFALVLPLLNGIPFGLMGAYFNEVFARYRTMLSGTAYNLGRILAGFAPVLITALGLQAGGHYFLFSAALGVAVFVLGWSLRSDAGATGAR